MADIRPFRGLHYDPSLVGDLSRVICPPYDIISPQQQEELYARSPYNFVRLECGREFPYDTADNNRYSRAAATLQQWLQEGVLVADAAPAIYLHDHYFRFQEKECRRRSMLALVRLEEWDSGVVRPHEGTLSGPRRDRLDLLWALRANTSPVLAMYEDEGIAPLLESHAARPPVMRTSARDGERHEVWAITGPEAIGLIREALASRPLYIADGHHRYTSALTYRRQRRAYSPAASGDEPYDFVMMSLVDFADPGLFILAPHRLVGGIPPALMERFVDSLGAFFEVDRVPLSTPDLWRRADEILARPGSPRLSCFGPEEDSLLLLQPRPGEEIGRMMPSFHSPLYQALDVSIVDHVILEKLLGIDTGSHQAGIAYSQDRQEALQKVRDGEFQLAFFLSQMKPELVKAVADSGETMPRKSTYFYPKTPVGLVFNRLG